MFTSSLGSLVNIHHWPPQLRWIVVKYPSQEKKRTQMTRNISLNDLYYELITNFV